MDDHSTRALLLQSGKRLFSLKGYDGTTVKDLADEAGVNISLVSYYFGGKEGLYRACLQDFSDSRLQLAKRILTDPESVDDLKVRLSLFFQEMIQLYVDEPDLTRLVHCANDSSQSITDTVVPMLFKIFDMQHTFLKLAQNKGFIDPAVDVQITTRLCFGMLAHVIKTDHLQEKQFAVSIRDSNYRERVLVQLRLLLFEGILQKKTHP
ncbi:MAG: TetR family transcriptional regulator [Candidatus Margulisiibacteriota bacterium]